MPTYQLFEDTAVCGSDFEMAVEADDTRWQVVDPSYPAGQCGVGVVDMGDCASVTITGVEPYINAETNLTGARSFGTVSPISCNTSIRIWINCVWVP